MADTYDLKLALIEVAWEMANASHTPDETGDDGVDKLVDRFNKAYNKISLTVIPKSTEPPKTSFYM